MTQTSNQRTLLTLILCLISMPFFAQVTKYNDWQMAKALAQKTDKNILIILTGAEWCKPCIKLEKNVIENDAFISFANDKLVIFEINMPRHMDLDSQVVKDYITFRDKYETNALPTLILTDHRGIEKARITNGISSVDKVLGTLKENL